MQGILETPGPTVPGNLEHGQVKEAPNVYILSMGAVYAL
jgi:hypothetical protein